MIDTGGGGFFKVMSGIVVLLTAFAAIAQPVSRVVDIPTRTGVTQRFVLIVPEKPKATAILLAGGNGWLKIAPDGGIGGLGGNFLVRSRGLFVEQGLAVAVPDAPSDRQDGRALDGFRTSAEHVVDLEALIVWLRAEVGAPVWLMGTSRGTQSAAYAASRLAHTSGGPDGIMLSSSILKDRHDRPVSAMDLDRILVPVLVVHHRDDDCHLCLFTFIPELMRNLAATTRKDLFAFEGGISTGDPCGARAYHGYNGIERDVVAKISNWITR